MIADLPRVIGQLRGALGIVLGLDRVEVRDQRGLRIDDDALAAGKPDDEIGTEARLLDGVCLLFDKVGVLDHPGELDDLPQLHFAPVTAHVRLTKRLHEPAGLALKRHQSGAELSQLFRQRCRCRDAFDFHRG